MSCLLKFGVAGSQTAYYAMCSQTMLFFSMIASIKWFSWLPFSYGNGTDKLLHVQYACECATPNYSSSLDNSLTKSFLW